MSYYKMLLRIKNSIYNTINTKKIMEKQEAWRQKQIETYYIKGRPIFSNNNNYNYNKSRFVIMK